MLVPHIKVFEGCIGKQIEVYIDNMVDKTSSASNIISDLQNTFDHLNKFNVHLKPLKCTFGLQLGKCLGYLMALWGNRSEPRPNLCDHRYACFKEQERDTTVSRSIGSIERIHLKVY